MSTLDEIIKEKQRVGEALARVDAQREKLTGQLSELQATERVLARYSKGTRPKKTATAEMPTTATKAPRLTKIKHPWTNGQVERMNRTIKEATSPTLPLRSTRSARSSPC